MIADNHIQALIPIGLELACAVRDMDPQGVREALTRAERHALPGDANPLHALLVVIAAAVDVEMTVTDLYGWTQEDPARLAELAPARRAAALETRDEPGCVDCGRDQKLQARGLCNTCYKRHRDAGTIDQFPRLTKPRDELLSEVRHLMPGSTFEIAERLGVTRGAIARAAWRAGDKELGQKFSRETEAA